MLISRFHIPKTGYKSTYQLATVSGDRIADIQRDAKITDITVVLYLTKPIGNLQTEGKAIEQQGKVDDIV